jgi:hypothetical protein
MRFLKKIRVLVIVAPFLMIGNSFADEASDAVELLKQSFKCPKKADMIGHSIDAYVGDERTFSLKTNRSDGVALGGGRGSVTLTFTADYEKLASAIHYSRIYISLSCKGKAKCIHQTSTDEPDIYSNGIGGIDLCDADTAANIKLAIDTLIRLSSK